MKSYEQLAEAVFEARANYERNSDHSATRTAYVEALIDQARYEKFSSFNFSKAYEICAELERIDKTNVFMMYHMGFLQLIHHNNPEKAFDYLQNVLDASDAPQSLLDRASGYLAGAFYLLDDPESASELLDELLEKRLKENFDFENMPTNPGLEFALIQRELHRNHADTGTRGGQHKPIRKFSLNGMEQLNQDEYEKQPELKKDFICPVNLIVINRVVEPGQWYVETARDKVVFSFKMLDLFELLLKAKGPVTISKIFDELYSSETNTSTIKKAIYDLRQKIEFLFDGRGTDLIPNHRSGKGGRAESAYEFPWSGDFIIYKLIY